MTPRITTINCARCDSPPGTTDGCESCEAYARQQNWDRVQDGIEAACSKDPVGTMLCSRCGESAGATAGCLSCEALHKALRDRDRACYGWHMYPVGPMPPGFREWLTRHNGVKRG